MPQNNKNKKTTLPTGPLGEVGCRDGYGPMWAAVSNTPYRQYKIETFDGGLSAPFIIRYPSKIRPGSRYHSPFLLQDIAPTCLAWAALPIPAHMDPIYYFIIGLILVLSSGAAALFLLSIHPKHRASSTASR